MSRAVCTFIANPHTLTGTGKAFVDAHRKDGITDARVAVVTAPDGSLPTSLFVASANAYKASGIALLPQFTRGFAPVGGETQGVYPNDGLNQTGDRLTDAYIDAWSLRVCGFMRTMHFHSGWDRCLLWNEENEAALLPEGQNPDPAGLKPGSMNPRDFAGLAITTAKRLTDPKHGAGTREVWLGPLSVLPQTGTDSRNGYYAAYLEAFYKELEAYGYRGEHLPFAGWGVNSEGYWTDETFGAEMAVLRRIMAEHHHAGRILCTEFGLKNSIWTGDASALAATQARVDESYAAVRKHTDGPVYVFQWPGDVPNLDETADFSTYGVKMWREANGQFLVVGDYRWAAHLGPMWASAGD